MSRKTLRERVEEHEHRIQGAFVVIPALAGIAYGLHDIAQADRAIAAAAPIVEYQREENAARDAALRDIERRYNLALYAERAHEISASFAPGADVVPLGEPGARVLYSPDIRRYPLDERGYLLFPGRDEHSSYALPVGQSKMGHATVREMLDLENVNLPPIEVEDISRNVVAVRNQEDLALAISAGVLREDRALLTQSHT